MFSTFERSEPRRVSDIKIPAASHTEASQIDSALDGSSSFEHSEPHRGSDRTISENGPFSKIEPRASGRQRPEPNRGTMKNQKSP
jgi:hypothetical protein